MGGGQSTPAPPPQMTDTPWREINGWDRSVRDELKKHVASLKQETDGSIEVPYCNIVLTGQIGAGKSSFFNSINNIFANRIAVKADVGKAAKSLTKELRVYGVKTHHLAAPPPWRIIDTMGLDVKNTDGEADVRNLLKAVDGHVPDKHVFTEDRDFYYRSPNFVANPTLAQQAHCVAVVIDASQAKQMKEDMWKKLRSLRQGLISRNMPTYIILTHIDEACKKVEENVQNVHHSISIRDLVSFVGKQLMGLPENQIFPVKNYNIELNLKVDLDILLLYALRQMLYSAKSHIESQRSSEADRKS